MDRGPGPSSGFALARGQRLHEGQLGVRCRSATVAADVRRLLEEGGYAWDEQRQQWIHPVSKRALDPAIAASLTAGRIAAGRWPAR